MIEDDYGLGNPDYFLPPWEEELKKEQLDREEILFEDPPF